MLLLPPLLPITILPEPPCPPTKCCQCCGVPPTAATAVSLLLSAPCSFPIVGIRTSRGSPWWAYVRARNKEPFPSHLLRLLDSWFMCYIGCSAGPVLLSMRPESAWIDEGINTELRSSWWKPGQVSSEARSLYTGGSPYSTLTPAHVITTSLRPSRLEQ